VTDDPLVLVDQDQPLLLPDTHRRLGIALFNRVWALLDLETRPPEMDDELVHAAHASCYHWSQAGADATPDKLVIGEWQCARVYSTLGRAEPALFHAHRAMTRCEGHIIDDWLLASVHEGLARASHVAGDGAERDRWLASSRGLLESVEDDEDRAVVQADIDEVERLARG
jgi:hypothetical protein